MRFDTLIRNGIIVTATDMYAGEVGIAGDKVSAIGAQLPSEKAGRIIDAAGCYVMPGGIDVHTHLDMPFAGTTSAHGFDSGPSTSASGWATSRVGFPSPQNCPQSDAGFIAWGA